jgi:hypothetical protein
MYSRTQSVQHIVGLVVRLGLVVVGRCCWGLRRGGITKDSPEHSRTVLVDIYRLRCWVAYGGESAKGLLKRQQQRLRANYQNPSPGSEMRDGGH